MLYKQFKFVVEHIFVVMFQNLIVDCCYSKQTQPSIGLVYALYLSSYDAPTTNK